MSAMDHQDLLNDLKSIHMAILPRTFLCVRSTQRRTRTKVRERGRVRCPPTVLDFLYVEHVYDVQMNELAVFRWAYYHIFRFKSNGVFSRYTL